VELNCCGMQCPGPIRQLTETMEAMQPGDEVVVCATDPGFASDAPAWCRKRGHEVIEMAQDGARTVARIRKAGKVSGLAVGGAKPPEGGRAKKTMVVFSGDLDRVLAAFIIANGAVSMGSDVTLFFTFWGLNALRKPNPPPVSKAWLDRMFGWMMPRGAAALRLSKLNMLGAGTAMMKHVMRAKNVDSLPQLIEQARRGGVKLVACAMSMDIMGIRREELIDGVEMGGVAAFLGESDDADMTLFV
jgi:peroxiredoxin family protein/TusA-related sulfurtransferase